MIFFLQISQSICLFFCVRRKVPEGTIARITSTISNSIRANTSTTSDQVGTPPNIPPLSVFLSSFLLCCSVGCVCVCVFAHLSCRKKKITPSDLLVWVFLRVLGSWRNQNGRRLAIDGFFYWWWTGSHWQVLSDDDVSDQRNRSHSIAFR